jgi:hypothetical protein
MASFARKEDRFAGCANTGLRAFVAKERAATGMPSRSVNRHSAKQVTHIPGVEVSTALRVTPRARCLYILLYTESQT